MGGAVHLGANRSMRFAVGKTCLPTTAKPHSEDRTVEGSSGTRRTSDPVETGLRHAHTRTAPGPEALRAAPSGNVEKKGDALRSSARLQSAGWAAAPVLIHIWVACLGNRLRLRLWPAPGAGISRRAKIWGHLQRTRLPTRWFPGPGSPPPAAEDMPEFPEVRGAERLPPRTPPADGSKQSVCA